MATEIEKLTEEDRKILLKGPALVAILAAISDDGEISNSEKTESIKLSHLRTYTSEPMLQNYYRLVEEEFVKDFNEIQSKLPESWEEKQNYIEEQIAEMSAVLPKLNDIYARSLVASLKSFAKHVFKSNSSFLEYFLFPVFMNRVEKDSFDPKIGE
jgi:hypothetical protein